PTQVHAREIQGVEELAEALRLRLEGVFGVVRLAAFSEAGEVEGNYPADPPEIRGDRCESILVRPDPVHEHERIALAAVEIGELEAPDRDRLHPETTETALEGERRTRHRPRDHTIERDENAGERNDRDEDAEQVRHVPRRARGCPPSSRSPAPSRPRAAAPRTTLPARARNRAGRGAAPSRR